MIQVDQIVDHRGNLNPFFILNITGLLLLFIIILIHCIINILASISL